MFSIRKIVALWLKPLSVVPPRLEAGLEAYSIMGKRRSDSQKDKKSDRKKPKSKRKDSSSSSSSSSSSAPVSKSVLRIMEKVECCLDGMITVKFKNQK